MDRGRFNKLQQQHYCQGRQYRLYQYAFETLEKFESYMGVIMSGRFGKIVRAKGFLPINNAWGKFDIVGNTYTMESIESMDGSKLILIGSNLDKDSLTILFNDCPKIQGKNKMNLELLSF